jgi:predicted nucleotidyltransferase
MVTAIAQIGLESLVSKKAASQIRTFCRDVSRTFPNRISKVMLFGSRARGDALGGSDYDVAVFVENYGDRRSTDHLLADIAYDHILAGVHISPVSLPSDYLESAGSTAFAQSLLRDGLVIS